MKAVHVQILMAGDSEVQECIDTLQALADCGAAYSIEFAFYEDVANPEAYQEKLPDRFHTKH
jgi:hypothetical protein